MKYLFTAIAFFVFIFFVSCDSKTDNKEPVPGSTVLPTTTNPVFPANNDTSSNLNTGVALNPKHGEPGHRCDIAEGAPLNSPAANTNTQATNTAIQPNVSTIIPPATTTTSTGTVVPNLSTITPTLNPKHGDPGHRCDIAVGAPLNSKPNQ